MRRFSKQEAHRYKRLRGSYRRPKGGQSKIRIHKKGNQLMVEIGFRTPSESRGLHPCGMPEALVFNVSELAAVKKGTAVRIAARVGTRKALQIAKKAAEAGMKVLNEPRPKRKPAAEKSGGEK